MSSPITDNDAPVSNSMSKGRLLRRQAIKIGLDSLFVAVKSEYESSSSMTVSGAFVLRKCVRDCLDPFLVWP